MRVPVPEWVLFRVLPVVGARCIRFLGKRLHLETRGTEHVDTLYREGRNAIFACWHGRQLMMPYGYRGKDVYVLVSSHRDGEIIYQILRRFGYHAVRGSTTRGGQQAFRKLVQIGRAGADIVITPDGPRGPCCRVQMGVIQLAKMTGLPIVPWTFACSHKHVFGSWDRFMVPYPMGIGLYAWGNPIWVESDASKAVLEAKRIELECALNRLSEEADAAVSQTAATAVR